MAKFNGHGSEPLKNVRGGFFNRVARKAEAGYAKGPKMKKEMLERCKKIKESINAKSR